MSALPTRYPCALSNVVGQLQACGIQCGIASLGFLSFAGTQVVFEVIAVGEKKATACSLSALSTMKKFPLLNRADDSKIDVQIDHRRERCPDLATDRCPRRHSPQDRPPHVTCMDWTDEGLLQNDGARCMRINGIRRGPMRHSEGRLALGCSPAPSYPAHSCAAISCPRMTPTAFPFGWGLGSALSSVL